MIQRLGTVRQHCQRGVVAHRADRFLGALGHRREQELQVLLGVAEGLLAIEQRQRRRHRGAVALDVVETNAQVVDPLPVRASRRELVLDLLVVDDAPGFHIDQEHLARLQPPLLDDLALGNRQHAGLRRHDHEVVVGHDVARRTQAVAVQRGADLAPVGERDCRRAVPRLHHRRVVLVERAAALVHQRVLLPRFRDHHHHRVRQRIAGHHQQLEAVVEARGVALPGVNQRPQLLQVLAEHRRADRAFTRTHPVVVALDGVDFAVVRDHAVGMRQRPLGEGVGREALVHQRQRRDHARILQVLVVLADLVGQQQALVDDGARRDRRHEVLLAVAQVQALDRVAGDAADHEQLALERVGHHHVRAAADEDLADHGFLVAHRRRHRHLAVDRNVAPADHDLPFGAHRALDLLLARQPRRRLARQEDHADAVLARRRQLDAGGGHFGAVVRVGDLQQDAGAVAHQLVGADRAAMVEVLQDQQPVAHDVVRLHALDMGDETDAAGVVLPARAIQALLDHRLDFGRLGHCRLRMEFWGNAGQFTATQQAWQEIFVTCPY
ncbi:hypothetical protein GALL_394070 [mine drainage metagenome]|uniref:Uncharacterized protein n=1 Tax=mine drainage metagenome TaxID=410659 RepID=A0A1J5QN13_9ZZZZ